MPIDVPPQLHERVVCSIAAATKYEIPANIMLAVAEQENGKPGQWVRNENGTLDVGTLQFNTAYLGQLRKYGITAADVAAAGCYPYELAAWRLRQHIRRDQGDLWTRSANYHSRTPRFNQIYREHLMSRGARWADWLASRYPTHEVVDAGFPILPSPGADENGNGTTPRARHRSAVPNWEAGSYMPRKLLIDGQP